jgi:basic membrane protein A
VLGWDPESQEGLFTNNFESLDDGRAFAQNLYDEGADIVLPVAGPVGLGSAALADELGHGQADDHRRRRRPLPDRPRAWPCLPDLDHEADGFDRVQVIERAMDGTIEGGSSSATLANGGVDIAPFHDFEDAFRRTLAELEEVPPLRHRFGRHDRRAAVRDGGQLFGPSESAGHGGRTSRDHQALRAGGGQ